MKTLPLPTSSLGHALLSLSLCRVHALSLSLPLSVSVSLALSLYLSLSLSLVCEHEDPPTVDILTGSRPSTLNPKT